MSKSKGQDIRSFFTVVSKKPATVSAGKSNSTAVNSDEDVVQQTPEQPKKKTSKKRRVQVLSSDSEPDSPKKSKQKNLETKSDNKSKSSDSTSKLKPVNIADVFNNAPIKQSKVEHVAKPVIKERKEEEKKNTKTKGKKNKPKTEIGVHEDKDFEQTLLDLDDDVLLENVDLLDKTIDEALSKETVVETKKDKSPKVNKIDKHIESKEESSEQSESDKAERNDSSDAPGKKRPMKDKPASETPSKKQKIEHSDSGIDPDQERYEKKRYSAMLYQKYLNRSGPKNQGMKEIPKGKPDCLHNLCFLRTGVLDSLDSEEFENLIKDHGGRVVHAVSKKVNYVVVGEDPGPAKLAKAESYNIPRITEDDLLDMIRSKSGLETKQKLSEDLGIDMDTESNKESIDSDFAADTEVSGKHSPESGFGEKKVSPKKHSDTSVKQKDEQDSKKSHDSSVKQKDKHDSKKSPKKEKHTHTETKNEDKPNLKKLNETKLKDSDKKKPEIISGQPPGDVSLSWTEKYKPKDIKAIIGQQGDQSNMNKLRRWLQNWHKNHGDKTKKHVRPSPWSKNDDGSYFKCALLSGPPGVGKTTTATLVAQDLGFDIVEFNASDTRSKRLLHEEVSQLLSTQTLAGFAVGQAKTSRKRVLIMDEVDGMAGNEDRGGIQELINLIKNTNVPVICMCNDRMHQKIRSLANYCYDLRFQKPRVEQVRGAMMSVCFKEGIKINPQALSDIISGTGCDIRQTLNHLSMWSSSHKELTPEIAAKESKAAKKDTVLGPWEVVRMVFNESDQKNMSLMDKARLFFYDYSLGPLFVQENYLKVQPHFNKKDMSSKQILKATLKRYSLAADAISMGDLIDSKIRGSNNWALLETQAIFSSVIPGHYMSGHFEGQINFPGWLGKNSKRTKFHRMVNEIQMHTRVTTQASKLAIKLDYLTPLRNAIMRPLKTAGADGIEKAVSVMRAYNLLREDLDNLIELTSWSKKPNPYASIDSKVKSAFTRAYNKEVPMLPFAVSAGVSKKKAALAEDTLEGEEEVIESANEDDDDIGGDAMIKVKTKAPSKNKKTTNEPSTSKKAEPKKGKGKKAK